MISPPVGTGLSTYVAVRRGDVPSKNEKLPLGYPKNPWAKYIGLRERPQDALERAEKFEKERGKTGVPVNSQNFVVLRFHFTHAGVAHFTLKNAGDTYNFASVLSKKVYDYDNWHKRSPCFDWNVWHFLEALPLELEVNGTVLIWTDVLSVEEVEPRGQKTTPPQDTNESNGKTPGDECKRPNESDGKTPGDECKRQRTQV